MRKKTFEMVILAFLGAMLVVGQVALSFLPNIEIVSVLIYVYAKTFRWKALIPVYIFVFLEGLIYGFSIWWMTYLYVWAILVAVAILVGNDNSVIVCTAVISLYGLAFGFLCAIPTFFIAGIGGGISFFVSGLPFDIAHFAGNMITGMILYEPLHRLFAYLARKYDQGLDRTVRV